MNRFRVPTLVRRLGLVSFFTDAASEMIYPLLPSLLRSFGAASVWLGAMEGLAEAASAAVKWRMGAVTDRAERKKPLVVAGYTVATFARPLLGLATAGWHVVALRAADRIGKGVRSVPRDAMLASAVPAERWATAFAYHRAMDNAGSVLGPILAFALLQGLALPVRQVMMAAVLPGLLSIAVLVFGVRERPSAERPHPQAGADDPSPAAAGALVPALPAAVRSYLAIVALFTLGASADSFLLLRAVDLGLSPAHAPLVWLALSAAKAASNVPGGRLADRLGRRRTLVLAWLVYAVAYASLGWIEDARLFAAVVVLYGLYYGLSEGAEKAILAERTPEAMRGRAFAAMHALTGLAVLPANLLFGTLYRWTPSVAFFTSAAIAACAAAVLALGARR